MDTPRQSLPAAAGNDGWLDRTRLLLGDARMETLSRSNVIVVGTGGVGAYAAEMLCRAGVGHLVIIDPDSVAPSNINRQLPALHSTIGQPKAAVLAARLKDINPALDIEARQQFIEGEAIAALLDEGCDFIVDAIDTISPKCDLIAAALARGVRIVSSMGAGAKTDPAQIKLADLWRTTNCGLAKAVRNGLKRRGIRAKLPVVFSTETPDPAAIVAVNEKNKKTTTGTISYMPALFGCHLAAYVLKHL